MATLFTENSYVLARQPAQALLQFVATIFYFELSRVFYFIFFGFKEFLTSIFRRQLCALAGRKVESAGGVPKQPSEAISP